MIKKSTGYLKYTVGLALVAALVALLIWIMGMYRSSLINYLQTVDKCLLQATDAELNIRLGKINNKRWFAPYTEKDTSTYITNTIEIDGEGIFHVRIRKDDPTALDKMRQFIFKFFHPINVVQIDSIFKYCMAENSLPVKISYIEYLDLEKDSLISSNAPKDKLSGYIASNIDTLDILKTIGVRAYTKTPVLELLRPVMTELIIAVALMLIVMACIIKMIVDIRRLHHEGFRFVRFMSLKAGWATQRAAQQIQGATEKLHIQKAEEASADLENAREGLLVNSGYFDTLGAIIKNEEGKIRFNKTSIRLSPFLEELKDRYGKIIYKNAFITTQMDSDIYLYTDKKYLERIFEELLDNCVKYSNDPVYVTIKAIHRGQKIIIAICDTGWGIEEKDLEDLYIINHEIAKLFKEGIKPGTKTGLGLSFVKSFMRTLGGTLKVTCEDGITGIVLTFTNQKLK